MSNDIVNQQRLPLQIILMACITLSACSNTATTAIDSNTGDSPQAATFDSEKPTSYAEYKRWRKIHSPSSEAYAEYKEWEIAYRRWKLQQEQ